MQAEQRTAEALAAARRLHADLTRCLPELSECIILTCAIDIPGMLLHLPLGGLLESQSFFRTQLARFSKVDMALPVHLQAGLQGLHLDAHPGHKHTSLCSITSGLPVTAQMLCRGRS